MNHTYSNEYTVKESINLIQSEKVDGKVNEDNEHFAMVQNQI